MKKNFFFSRKKIEKEGGDRPEGIEQNQANFVKMRNFFTCKEGLDVLYEI